jgi:hypothetical protein
MEFNFLWVQLSFEFNCTANSARILKPYHPCFVITGTNQCISHRTLAPVYKTGTIMCMIKTNLRNTWWRWNTKFHHIQLACNYYKLIMQWQNWQKQLSVLVILLFWGNSHWFMVTVYKVVLLPETIGWQHLSLNSVHFIVSWTQQL